MQQLVQPLPQPRQRGVSGNRDGSARAFEASGTSEHVEIPVDHPDARGRTRQSLDDLLISADRHRRGPRWRHRGDYRRRARLRRALGRQRVAGTEHSNNRGRSCSAVATACAVPASVRSCASRRNRSVRARIRNRATDAGNTVSTSSSCARMPSATRRDFTPAQWSCVLGFHR